MSRTSGDITIISVFMGTVVPVACIYAVINYGLNSVTAAVISIAAIVLAGGVAVVGIVLGPLGHSDDGFSRAERDRLRAMRVHQKATLEELDDIIEVLGEIRDILKSVEE
ncbi:MAG: hypothetical protein JSV27_06855 [Candidatus Bathyarchaeota archaeon]|nr:MAG: hypothetical protein JSV27_06855 [Candidatus Bathyarchaeota archaeon]